MSAGYYAPVLVDQGLARRPGVDWPWTSRRKTTGRVDLPASKRPDTLASAELVGGWSAPLEQRRVTRFTGAVGTV